MKFTRKASANWQGGGKDGKGTLSSQSGILDKTQYSFHTRFEDGSKGTNPEELIGAAHAGCFTMQLSFLLVEEGFTATSLDTDAKVFFEDGAVVKIELNLKGKIDGIDAGKFRSVAQKAKEICPISKLLDTEIDLNVELD